MRHASSADRVAEFARVAWTPRHQIHLATGNNRWLGPPLALALVAAAALSPKVGFVQFGRRHTSPDGVFGRFRHQVMRAAMASFLGWYDVPLLESSFGIVQQLPA